jgi:protein MpaA
VLILNENVAASVEMKHVGRGLGAAVFVSILVTLAAAAAASARTVMLGRSGDGRPIDAIEVGNPRAAIRVLVFGCIHGNETAGIAIARALERVAPRDLDVWVVPDLNPDGVAAGTRQDGRGVDINRNFPWRWRPMSGVYASGPHPFSEREARIARALILRLRPHVTIWFHQHLDMVWAAGGNRRIERTFARVSGLPYHPMPPLAGTSVSWQNHTLYGTTAFAAELPAGEPTTAQVRRYVRATLAAARTG